eukprot:CAMPEP_0171311600 /NCGR_PEP_ID=MMETSP0816-20121228/21868_1 /TAXON_ID=420281 /ORGANISM="Proboscia inermis, Strain CCAP1064/1" /LENGTH=274 /DNA_ID=CAMNT_0011796477 /DNA_START=751 /DNA_END=1575 /DNA_ORIENTATION=+
MVGVLGMDNFRGAVVEYYRPTTTDQFTPLNGPLKGEEEGDYFGWTVYMTPNGLSMVVAAYLADFGGIDSGSVYLFLRDTTNDPFIWVDRADGGCEGELLGQSGVAIEAREDTLLVHAKATNGACIDNSNNIRTYRVSPISSAPSTSTASSTSASPSVALSAVPSDTPSTHSTHMPSTASSVLPSTHPTTAPSAASSAFPSTHPTAVPSAAPSTLPSTHPTASLSDAPSAVPSDAPSKHPTAIPSAAPSDALSASASASTYTTTVVLCVLLLVFF